MNGNKTRGDYIYIKRSVYDRFDMYVLDYKLYIQYTRLIGKKLKGKLFSLPESDIKTIPVVDMSSNYGLFIFTQTLSPHHLFIKKVNRVIRVGETTKKEHRNQHDWHTYIPSELVNKKRSTDFFFRSFLCYATPEDAEKEIEFLVKTFTKHKIIIKGTF